MKKGYTLLEVLISISIISIIFVIGYAGFREFARRQALQAAVRNVRGDLRLAQEQAFAGKKPDGCNTLSGFSFEIVEAAFYEISAVCNNGNYLVKEEELPEGVIFEPIPSTNPVLFKVLGLGTNIAAGGRADITFLQEATSNTNTIAVNWTGEIK